MVSRRQWIGGVAAAAALGAALSLLRRGSRSTPSPGPMTTAIAPNGWPEPSARLTPVAVTFPPDWAPLRVYLDAGHGATDNHGNTSCLCVEEQDFTLATARALGERLDGTGRFRVRLSRTGEQPVDYRARIDAAREWGADVFVSLHSDVRGRSERWSPQPGASCPVSWAAPGFSVLWSDEAEPPLSRRRRALAHSVARRLAETGFAAYGGADYASLYQADAEQPGVFVDRHALEQRIFVLRRPEMPSVLIETHHALDPREARRWAEAPTLDAFAAAVAAALLDARSAEAVGVGAEPPGASDVRK